MDNQEELAALMSYFNKLEQCINREAAFSFGDRKIYDKRRIDDILCCIEASMPPEFKRYLNAYGESKQIKTYKYQRQLQENIKIKPPIGNSSYFVKVSETLQLIAQLKRTIPSDLGYLRTNFPNIVLK